MNIKIKECLSKIVMKENMKKILASILKNTGICIGVIALLFSVVCGGIMLHSFIRPAKYQVYEEMTQLQYEATKLALANEVDAYIKSVAKSSCLNGIVIVDKCEEYSIDICFVLAQGQLESHFGTAGLARKTNSVWNVWAFNGQSYNEISSKGKYKSPDDSVDAYLSLLKKRYLVNGKTEYDMMTDFVDKDGNRYASAGEYENKIFKKFTEIRNTTKIDSLSLEMKRYAIILGY